MSRAHDDSGTALIELIGLSIMLLVPICYLAVSVFAVQKGVFAATAAAQEAGRALVRAESSAGAINDAQHAASLSLDAQGFSDGKVSVHAFGDSCGAAAIDPDLAPGSTYVVCVSFVVAMPFAGWGLLTDALHPVGVTGKTTVTVDNFRSER